MRVERLQHECCLCHAVIWVPAGFGLMPPEEYCGLCAIHVELSALVALLDEMKEYL